MSGVSTISCVFAPASREAGPMPKLDHGGGS
jgi:hypothetical protein